MRARQPEARRRPQRSRGEIQPIGIAAVVLVLAVAAVALWPVLTVFDLPFNQVDASIHLTATLAGRSVHVSGTTDLPDGAVVVCYLANGEDDVGEQAQAAVADSAFALDLAVPWSILSGEADCRFGTAWAAQPKNVLDQYGRQGERMSGSQVFRESLTTPKEIFATAHFGPIGPSGSPTLSSPGSPGPS